MAGEHTPGGSGRSLVVSVTFAVCVVAWLIWTIRPAPDRGITPELWMLAAAGGVLCGASPNSAASAFVFVAVVAAGVRAELSLAFVVVAVGSAALAVSVLLYNGSGLGLVAYTLGFAAATLGGANSRQAATKAEQAELLLAQTQRSHEEQLRAARLEESTRIARDIHDLLAHALAGLTLQLEATSSLLDQGADRATIKARLDRAHALAREGLRETRRAVGALRGEPIAARGRDRSARRGVPIRRRNRRTDNRWGSRSCCRTGRRQPFCASPRRPSPTSANMRRARAFRSPCTSVTLRTPTSSSSSTTTSATTRTGEPAGRSGGGYGVPGMHERAQALGGTVTAGPHGRWLAGRVARSRWCRACGPGTGGAMSDPIRVLVADDQALVREGLMTLLDLADGIEPVAAACDGEEAVLLATRHRPDVVLMDLRMPRLDGVEATRRIRATRPATEIVVLTTHADDQSILGALQAGARGYLTKDAGIAEIARAIQAAAAHQALLDPAVQSRLVAAATTASAAAAPAVPIEELPDELTRREAEVLRLIARGMSNTEIAVALVVSEATVKSHINHLFAKISARDRAQAVHYAYTHGLTA